MPKVISVDQLTPGMMITQVVEQNGPVKIRKVGLVRSQDMITGLSEMGVVKVEIDPEQAIELEPETATHSMTQKLLQGDYDHASQVDSTLSEQFNRSLFLPSVSELPSMTQIYLKQAAVGLGVMVLGLGLGFTAAWAPAWFNAEPTTLTTESSNSQPVTAASEQPIEAAASEQSSVPADSADIVEGSSLMPKEPESQPGEQTIASPSATQTPVQTPTEPTERILGVQPAAPEQPAPQTIDPLEEALQEGELLTQQTDEAQDSAVSAELLQRFNQALQEIESSPETTDPDAAVGIRDDIPRVDQLPARTLTLLPSLEFSAHMYASLRSNRWVRVNGMQLYEGEWITDEVQLVNIEPQRVVLSFRGDLFTMAALTDW